MKSSVIAVFIVAILVIVGGYVFWRSSQNVPAEVAEETAPAESMLAGTFAALVRGGNDVQCDFSQRQGTTTTSGKVHITDRGERIRGDFMVMNDGEHSEAHLIRVDGWNYIWSSEMPEGVKTMVTAENREKLFEGENGGIPDDVAYTCSEWQADNAAFEVPRDVVFNDMSAMLEGAGSGDTKAAQCEACEQAGAAREQCLKALKCEE